MSRVKIACVAFATATVLALASLTFGQPPSIMCEDTATLLKAASYEITIEGAGAGKAKLVFGDLGGRCLPRPVVAVITFVIQWGKDGIPRTVGNLDSAASLVFPAMVFSIQDQVAADRATVLLKRTSLKTSTGVVRGGLIFELVKQTTEVQSGWRVISISMVP